MYEAARVDGASAWRRYRSVTLPLLRPALLVAAVLNVIYVFNSFPIIWTLNDRNPGFAHDTMITYMYKIAFKSAQRDVGLAAALGVVNVLVILVAVLAYLRTVRWREERGLSRAAARRCALAAPALLLALGAPGPLPRDGPDRAQARGRAPDHAAAAASPWTGASGTSPTVLGDAAFQGWLRASLIVAVTSTALAVAAAVPAAYHTARHRFRGRTAFLLLVLVTQMFSPTALVVGLYREFFDWGLVNTYAALILTNAAFNLAFAVWMLRGFFASIPREIEEAAAVDGCGRLGVLLRVVLPLARPAIATALIFSFIAAWNEYVVALTLMTDAARRPLTVGITSYVTAYVQHWNLLFAASVIALVPVVILFALIERHLVGGLTAGSVK